MHTCDVCGEPCDCALNSLGDCTHCVSDTPAERHDDALDDYESDFETEDDDD